MIIQSMVLTLGSILGVLFFFSFLIRNTEKGPNIPILGWFIRNIFNRSVNWVWTILVSKDRFLHGEWGIPVEDDQLNVNGGTYIRDDSWTYLKKNQFGGVSPVCLYKENRPVGIYLEEFSHSRESSKEARQAIQRAYAKTSFQKHLSTFSNPVFIMAFLGFLGIIGIIFILVFQFWVS